MIIIYYVLMTITGKHVPHPKPTHTND